MSPLFSRVLPISQPAPDFSGEDWSGLRLAVWEPPLSRYAGPSDLGTILGTVLDDNYRLQLGIIDTQPEWIVAIAQEIPKEDQPVPTPETVETFSKPETPQDFTASVAGDDMISLRWNAVDRAVSYRLEYLGPRAVAWKTIFSGPKRKFRHTKLSVNAAYQYRLVAVTHAGESDYAVTSARTAVSAAASSDAELLVTATGADSVSVTWWVGFAEKRCVGIEWSSDGRHWNSVTPENDAISFSINDLEQDTEYVIRVEFVDEDGSATYSNTVSTRTNRVVPPSVPTALGAVATNQEVKLTWTVSDSTTRTIVQRAPSPNGPWMTVLAEPTDGKTDLFWIDTVSTAETLFFYRFRAVNPLGVSVWAGPVTVANGYRFHRNNS